MTPAALGLLATIGATADAGAASAANANPSQWTALSQLNADRYGSRMSQLPLSAGLTAVAQAWAQRLAATGHLEHNPSVVGQVGGVAPHWTRIGENVGYGPTLAAVNSAYMASPDHRANILGPYTAVGLGVAVSGNRVYTVEDFVTTTDRLAMLAAPTAHPAPAPPPPPPTQVGATAVGPGTLDLLTVPGGHAAVSLQTLAGSASTTRSLGGIAIGGAGAAATGSGDVLVSVRGSNGAVWVRQGSGGAWSSWRSLGGIAVSTPAVASAGGTATVFAEGTDHRLWQRSTSGAGWTPWRALGGYLTSAPSAAGSSGAAHVAVRGQDGAVWLGALTASGDWLGWRRLGGRILDGPALTTDGTGMSVAAVGTTESVWVSPTGRASWRNLGGSVTASPAAAAANGGMTIFVVGSDRHSVWRGTYTGSGWTGWSRG